MNEGMDKKVCLITHVADTDGAFPIILGKCVFSSLDTFSCEVGEVDNLLEEAIQASYDFIYIVDLNVSEEMAVKINNEENLRNKILVFDHHESNFYLNKYPFIQVVVTENDRKECGSTLFYKYLKEYFPNGLLNKESLKQILELIRQVDTFDFTEDKKEDAFRIGSLYGIFGREKFIERYYEYILNNDIFSFSELELTLLEIENERNNRYVEEKLKHVKKAKIDGVSVGIVFAEQNRSFLGHTIASTMPDIDIAVIINVDRSVSYRADKEDVDINVLAVSYGGGGHKHAGGNPLPEDLQEKICEYIFKDVQWENEE